MTDQPCDVCPEMQQIGDLSEMMQQVFSGVQVQIAFIAMGLAVAECAIFTANTRDGAHELVREAFKNAGLCVDAHFDNPTAEQS